MTKSLNTKFWMQLVSIAGLLCCAAAGIWGWRIGVLTDPQAMAALVAQAGHAGLLLFTLFQAVQVVIPILPGGIGCLVGVVLFGPWMGFLSSYVGICIGSMMAFAIAKQYGRPLLPKLFKEETIAKYEHWTNAESPFARWFAIAIFLPVAPDDFLCYLAGTTEMSWKRFTAIIWAGKPFAIAAYSWGLAFVFDKALGLLA